MKQIVLLIVVSSALFTITACRKFINANIQITAYCHTTDTVLFQRAYDYIENHFTEETTLLETDSVIVFSYSNGFDNLSNSISYRFNTADPRAKDIYDAVDFDRVKDSIFIKTHRFALVVSFPNHTPLVFFYLLIDPMFH